MVLRRILRYFNAAVGLGLLCAAGAIYWYGWRTLPEYSGITTAPLSAEATIERDARAVPHIRAGSVEDALFLQGYTAAQDRMFQMDMLRRLGAGEVAEVAGAKALETDRQARRLGLRRTAERYLSVLPAAERAVLAAYARGVNHYLSQNRGRLAPEFTLLSYEPRHWTPLDSLLVLVWVMESLDRSWPEELRKEILVRGGDPEKLQVLFPAWTGGGPRPGSNGWAVNGKWTSSGRPILAGDTHLEFSLPPLWHMVHLQAPGLNVTGFAIAGLPGVLAGHNEKIAWTITSLPFDVQDLYVERFDPASGRYVFANRVEQAQPEREVIRVRNQAPEVLTVWHTRHGPVILRHGERLLALRWNAYDWQDFRYPVLELNRAMDWGGFRAALARLKGPGLTFVYADAAGNIGWQAAGRFPIRAGHDGSTPADGASGKHEWQGYIPFEQLPWGFNPESGIVVSANECPFPASFSYPVSGYFAGQHRRCQIEARLKERHGWRPGEMLGVQTDVYSTSLHFLARLAVEAFERKGASYPDLKQAIELLRAWDGQMRPRRPAPMVARLLFEHVRTGVGNLASPGNGLAYRSGIAPEVLEELLRKRPSGWVGDYDSWLLECLRNAIREGTRMQGSRIERWDYGRLNLLVLEHPVLSQLPWVGRYFRLGPVTLGGFEDTIQQVASKESRLVGPSMRMVVDVGSWDNSLMNLTTGQCGQVLSKHYKDQWKSYLEGSSFPAQFVKVTPAYRLRVLPEGR